MEIPNKMGIFMSDVDLLLKGQCTINIANKLGVYIQDVEDFIIGRTSHNMATRLGLTPSAADELVQMLGDSGAVGILVGILLSRSS